MRVVALSIAALLVPLSALAQSQLERMETVSERANALMNEAMVLQSPQLEGRMPSPDWDDPMRAAYDCVLQGYRAEAGDAGVDQMLDQMEAAMADATAQAVLNGELTQQVDLPDGVTAERGAELMTTCGVMELFMARMAASGIVNALSDQIEQ